MAKSKKCGEEIVKAAKTTNKTTPITRKDLLSTGSTLLNLACSGNPYGGFVKGKYYLLVGDSASGKTFLSMTCFAEAQRTNRFQHYRLIYDNVEDGCLMDVPHLFGQAVADHLEFPAADKDGAPVFSETIEDFYYNLDDALKLGKPFIYVLDSMDGLSSVYEGEKFVAHKKAHRKGVASAGSFGDGKARKNSEGLRKILSGIRDSGSILIILAQTRDNLGFGFEKKIRSGGHALRFYATVEIWTRVLGKIKRTVKEKARAIGVRIGIQIKKNRITGKNSEVEIAIYPSYGIDDIGSCVDYLVDECWWKKPTKKSIAAQEFDVKVSRDKLIQLIEKNGWEDELISITGKCWKEIDAASIPIRKPRY